MSHSSEAVRPWWRTSLALVGLIVVVLAIGVTISVLVSRPSPPATSMPFAQYDYQIRTEKVDGVVIFPSIYSVVAGVGSAQCEPLQLAPIGSYSGIFISDDNGQIIQRTTVGSAGNYMSMAMKKSPVLAR